MKRDSHRLLILAVPLVLWALAGCASSSHPHARSMASEKKDASYYYLLAEMEGRKNHPAKAVAYLDTAVQKDPQQPRLWYKRAFFNAASGNIAKAEEDVQKAIALDPKDAEAWTLLGKIHQSQDQRPEAAAAYQKALNLDPTSEDANVLLIETYVAQNDPKSALRIVLNWEKRDPENMQPYFYDAWLQQNYFKNDAKAIAAYEKVLNLEPDNAKALQALAEIYVNQKNDQKVLNVFRQMEASQPNDEGLKLKMALIYYEQKRYEEAIAKFQELLKSRPDEDRIVYYLGVIYENLKKDAEAEVQFRKIKANSNFFKDARLHLAYLKVRAEKKPEAIDLLEEAIDIRPEIGPFYEYLSEIYRGEGKTSAAIETLKTGIHRSQAQDKELLYYDLGLAYDRAGQFDECIRAMRQVLKINPQNANAMNYIGYSFADRGINLDEAVSLLQKANSLKPEDGYIMDSLGWAYFKRGDFDQAFLNVQRAYALTPGEPTIAEHMGDLFAKKGDAAKALKYYRESQSLLEKKKPEKGEAGDEAEDVKKDRERVLKKIQELKP